MGGVTAGGAMRVRRQAVPGFGADQIRAARTALGLTAKEMAKHAKVSERTYGNWENGKTVPSVTKVGALVSYLRERGVDPSTIRVTVDLGDEAQRTELHGIVDELDAELLPLALKRLRPLVDE